MVISDVLTLLCFNSILVRLKDNCLRGGYNYDESFNSILVRLKDVAGLAGQFDLTLFQFHSGTIKSQTTDWGVSYLKSAFQFHSGTIKRVATLRPLASNQTSFNSILVRLKEENRNTQTVEPFGVSIPFWYD